MKWLRDVKASFKLIETHLPISDIALIAQDYLATPMPRDLSNHCFRCRSPHRRKTSNLCTSCSKVCLICNKLTCSENKLWCTGCFYSSECAGTLNILKTYYTQDPKSHVYGSWYGVRFYSEIVQSTKDAIRREDANPILKAYKEERDREIAKFHAIEAAKSMCDKYIECRQKLWEAYDEINRLRAKYPSAKIAARPEFPFY